MNNPIIWTNTDFTLMKKHQNKKFLSRLNECLNGFVIGNITLVGVAEDELVGRQNDVFFDNFGCATFGKNITSHNQVIERNLTDRVKEDFDKVVSAVKNRVHGAISAEMDTVVIQRVEMVVRSIIG